MKPFVMAILLLMAIWIFLVLQSNSVRFIDIILISINQRQGSTKFEFFVSGSPDLGLYLTTCCQKLLVPGVKAWRY